MKLKTYLSILTMLATTISSHWALAELTDPTPRMVNTTEILGSYDRLRNLNDGSYAFVSPTGASAQLTNAPQGTVAWSCNFPTKDTHKFELQMYEFYKWMGALSLAKGSSSGCSEMMMEHSNVYSNIYENVKDNSEVYCEGQRCRGTFSAVSKNTNNYVLFRIDTDSYLHQTFELKNLPNDPLGRGCSLLENDMNNPLVKNWRRAMLNAGAWELAWQDQGECTELKTGKSWTNQWLTSGGISATHPANPQFDFYVANTTDVHINLMSKNTDTFLYLLKDDQIVLANDDGGNGTNSKIEQTLTPGRYTVVAATYTANASGTFTLTITSDEDVDHAMRFQDEGVINSSAVFAKHTYPIHNQPYANSKFRAVFKNSGNLSVKLKNSSGTVVASGIYSNGHYVLNAMLSIRTNYKLEVSTVAPYMTATYTMDAQADGGKRYGGYSVEMFRRSGLTDRQFVAYLENDIDVDSYTLSHPGGDVAIGQGISVPAIVEVRRNGTLISLSDFDQGRSNESSYRYLGYLPSGTYSVSVRSPERYLTETGKYKFDWRVF